MPCGKITAIALTTLACTSAASAPAHLETYGAIAGGQYPAQIHALQRALDRCQPEAISPLMGGEDPMRHDAALRACLSRQGFVDGGRLIYPWRISPYHMRHR